MRDYQKIIKEIFDSQGKNGCWKMLSESDKYYPEFLHYKPNFRATLWTLILLADISHDKNDMRVRKPLKTIQDHFYDKKNNIYSLNNYLFPVPCLNGNILYLESYFNGSISDKSLKAIEFFCKYQRFDDGNYITEKNKYCTNTSCYGQHTCYWGIVKLFKGLSFIPKKSRNRSINKLLDKCINYILLHNVCFSSRRKNKIMIKDIDKLTFPNMYKSDFLELLWLLKRENVRSEKISSAIDLLKSKRSSSGNWNLERKFRNMITSIGEINQPNQFVTKRAKEVLGFYNIKARKTRTAMLKNIHKEFKILSDKEYAARLQKYFKTGKGEYGEGDRFLGLRVPVIRKIAKKYRTISITEAAELLKSPFHEERLFSLFEFVYLFKKANDKDKKRIYTLYLNNTNFINNWDLVDASAGHIVGAYLFTRDKKQLNKLAKSKNLWERRVSILSTSYFIGNNKFVDALNIAEILVDDDEDLIHKAIGWMLREIGKRNIELEERFLGKHYKSMPRTALRYAIEKFPEGKRKKYLKGEL